MSGVSTCTVWYIKWKVRVWLPGEPRWTPELVFCSGRSKPAIPLPICNPGRGVCWTPGVAFANRFQVIVSANKRPGYCSVYVGHGQSVIGKYLLCNTRGYQAG